MKKMNPSKILVDGNCIVCDLEVSHYKRMAPREFEIIDISQPSFDAKKYGLTSAAVNKNLHVITPSGKLMIGVDAFAHIWGRIPRYSLGEKLIRVPGVYQLAKLGYKVFTVIRPVLPKKR